MPTFIKHFHRLAIVACVGVAGCSSVSFNTAENLDEDHHLYRSQECQTAIDDSVLHEQTKWARNIFSPVIVLATGGLALPAVVAANAQMEYDDRMHANTMSWHCGGDVKGHEEIKQEVISTSILSVATGTVSPSTLVGQTAKTTGR